tara:strand:- start:310 stop:423 length:114 start_codon:yes stop_codon:yes gene_type:complete
MNLEDFRDWLPMKTRDELIYLKEVIDEEIKECDRCLE